MIDDENFPGVILRFKFQAKLLLDRCEERGPRSLHGDGFHHIGTNTCLPQNGQREMSSLTDRRTPSRVSIHWMGSFTPTLTCVSVSILA